MFSGIVECLGRIVEIKEEGTNRIFNIASPISKEAYVDQSISHNGVCLTVTHHNDEQHTIVAIKETLEKTNLGAYQAGDVINLERSVTLNQRMDGHMVQGHVDSTATCIERVEENGSWLFSFKYDTEYKNLLVDKGSITINGVSLTLVNPTDQSFQVAIIPYTYEHTNFHNLKIGDTANIEFDVIGKYVARYMSKILAST